MKSKKPHFLFSVSLKYTKLPKHSITPPPEKTIYVYDENMVLKNKIKGLVNAAKMFSIPKSTLSTYIRKRKPIKGLFYSFSFPLNLLD